MKYFQCTVLFLLFLFGLSHHVNAQDNLALEDYQAYQSTSFTSPKWDEYVKQGLNEFFQNHLESSQTQLNKAFSLGCQSPIVLFSLALIHEYQRNYYSAFNFYDLAREKFKVANTDHRYAQTFDENYGRALYDAGKKDEAVPLLQKAAKKSKSFWLLKLVGMIAYDEGDTLNATSYFERAVRLETPDVTPKELVFIYTLLGRIYLSKSEKDGALRYYQKVLDFDPENREARKVVSHLQQNYESGDMKSILEQIQNN